MVLAKGAIMSVIGLIGGWLVNMFGGWDTAMIALCTFMAVDYITGLIIAGVFKKSPKSCNGGLESKAGIRGLVRKGTMLLIVLVSAQLDIMLGSTFVRSAVIIGFCANETISIIENAGLMGIPIPEKLKAAIAMLNEKEEQKNV